MELTLTTPALLFPAISLLLLAYTNRFLTLAQLARSLYDRYERDPDANVKGQLENLRYRIRLIKYMQVYAVLGFFCCVLCMFVVFVGQPFLASIVFGASLVLMLISLAVSLREVQVSIDAIELQFANLDAHQTAL
jgi:hypothetical protein